MSSALGREAFSVGALQTDFKTLGASPTRFVLPFYSEGFNNSGGLVRDEELGTPAHNRFDETDPAPALLNFSGPLTVAADMATVGYWLHLLLGDPVTSSGSGPYTRVFDSGQDPRFATQQFKTGASRWKVVSGLAFDSWSFDLGKADGYRQMTFNGSARDVVTVDDSEDLPLSETGLTLPTRAKAPATLGEFLVNDVLVGRVTGGSFNYQNSLQRLDFVDGDARASAMERDGGSTVSFSPTIRLARAANQNGILDVLRGPYDRATGQPTTPFDAKIRFVLSAGNSLTLHMPRCFGEERFETIDGPGGLPLSAQIRGVQSATAPALRVTLVNGLSAVA